MLIGVLIGLVVCYFIFRDSDLGWGMVPFGGFVTAIIAGFSIVAISLPYAKLTVPTTDVESPLVALQDGSRTSGSFFLASGTLNDYPAFTYYVKNGNENYLQTVYADDAAVIEYDGPPKVVYSCEDYRKVNDWIAWPISAQGLKDECEFLTFYVPKNSIVSDYRLDAK